MTSMRDESFYSRTGRVNDAIQLKVPDRVPIMMQFNFFTCRHAGISNEKAFYDLEAWLAAYEKTILDFEPDLYFQPQAAIFTGGKVHEALGNRQIKWPGHGVGINDSFQFVEGEYMLAEEYDAFLEDSSDFAVRKYLPRILAALEGLAFIPTLKTMLAGYAGAPALCGMLTLPPLATAFEALSAAAPESMRWTTAYMEFENRMNEAGYPAFAAGIGLAPFDVISDFLRGMRGAMLDMYRCPDKLAACCEKTLPTMLEFAMTTAQLSGNPRVFIPLHRGADGFMSNAQFETFYWPTLKALLLGLIDAGLTPCPFFEGNYDQRLDYLAELPRGKVYALFDRTDLVRAKEVIGDTVCISGGMPLSLLQAGTPAEVEEHTRSVIETVGVDGGFIMCTSTVLDEARPELVRAWMDATLKYGSYR